MKSIAFILIFFVCFSDKALATVLPATSDTTIPKTSLKKAALLKEFGNNDTCRALIEYWYSKRTIFNILSGVSAGLAAGGGLWYSAILKDDNRNNDNLGGFVVLMGEILLAALLVVAGGILLLIFTILLINSPRKKLHRILANFRNTGILPKKYLNKIKSRLQKNSK